MLNVAYFVSIFSDAICINIRKTDLIDESRHHVTQNDFATDNTKTYLFNLLNLLLIMLLLYNDRFGFYMVVLYVLSRILGFFVPQKKKWWTGRGVTDFVTARAV